MLRLKEVSKILANNHVRNSFTRHLVKETTAETRLACIPQRYFSDEGKKRIIKIQECKSTDMMSQLPTPKGGWYENEEKAKNKSNRLLLIGLLLTAAGIGAIYYIGLIKKPQGKNENKTEKKRRAVVKYPSSSNDIPKKVPYLLIGGGTAAFSAFRAIKSSEPKAKVLVVSNETFYPYMRPPLSKEIWYNEDKESLKNLMFKQWNGSERSLFYEPEDFYMDCRDLMTSENGGVAVARGWTITHLDVVQKLAYLDDGAAINYGKCLVATGATPKLSPVFEVAMADDNVNERIRLYRNIYDFQDAYEAYEQSKSIAIIGGGFLGSELACALGRKDKKGAKKIYQIFREGGNLGKVLPEYLSTWTTQKVKSEGVNVISQAEVVGIRDVEDEGLRLMLSNGKEIEVDFAIVSVGVEPNTQLAEKSDLEVDPELGGFLVNTELQARSDLYIAGDCACFYDPRLGRRRIEHHDHAVVSGRLAGENMTGARKPYYHQSMFWSDLGPEVGFEAIGIVDSTLPTVGVFAKATDEDCPKAAVTASGEGDRSKMEEVPKKCEKYATAEQKEALAGLKRNTGDDEEFGKGVVFYLRDDIVVGILLWNVFNRMSIARQVLKDQRKYDDLNEVAKLFNIHEEQ